MVTTLPLEELQKLMDAIAREGGRNSCRTSVMKERRNKLKISCDKLKARFDLKEGIGSVW